MSTSAEVPEGAIELRVESGVERIEFPGGMPLPAAFSYVRGYDEYQLELEIGYHEDRYECWSMMLRARKGATGSVSGALARTVTVAEHLRYAIRLLVLSHGASGQWVGEIPPGGADLWEANVRKRFEDLAAAGATDETLDAVAQIYTLAHAIGDPPTKSVQEQMGVSRATAGRWVAEARKRDLITVGG